MEVPTWTLSLTIVYVAQYCISMNETPDLYQSHIHEIRRGSVVIAALSLLREPQYGYALIDLLTSAGIEAEANTIYPLLRRLEKQGLLESVWNTDESRPRKFYQTTPVGSAMLSALVEEMNRITLAINLINGNEAK